jgi:hypothetical protein
MIIKNKEFNRWAKKAGLADSALCRAVDEMINGLVDADLGGGVYKKRVALPGRGKSGSVRTLLVTNCGDRWFFVLGFEKNERANITDRELIGLRILADDLLSMTKQKIQEALVNGSLVEVKDEKKE